MDNETLTSEELFNSEDTLSADETCEESDDETSPPNSKRRRFTFLDECHDDNGNADDIVDAPTEEDANFIDDTVFAPPSPYVPLPQPSRQPTLEDTANRFLNNPIADIEQRETPPDEAQPSPATFTWVPFTFTPMLGEIYDHASEQLGTSAEALDQFWWRMDNRYKLSDSDRFDGYGLPPECHGKTEVAAVLWLSEHYPYSLLRYIGREVWGFGQFYPESWRCIDGSPHFSWGQPVTGSPKLKAFAYEWPDLYAFVNDVDASASICSKVFAISACVRMGVVTRNRVLLLGLAYHAVAVPSADEAACRCLRVDKVADCLSLLLNATLQIGDYDEKLVAEKPQKMWWRYFMLKNGMYKSDDIFKYFSTTAVEQDVKNMWTVLFNSNQNVAKFVDDCACTVERMVTACGKLTPLDVLTHKWYCDAVPSDVWDAVAPHSTLTESPGLGLPLLRSQASWICGWLSRATQRPPLQLFLMLGHVLSGKSNRHRLLVLWGTETETGKSLFVSLVMHAVRTTRFTSLRPEDVDRIVAYAADSDLWCMDDANAETLNELMKHRSLLENTAIQSRKLYAGYKKTHMPEGLVATNLDLRLLNSDVAEERDKWYYLKKRGYWVNVMKKISTPPRYNKYLEVAFAGLLREVFYFTPAVLEAWEAGTPVDCMPLWSSVMTPRVAAVYRASRGIRNTSYMPYDVHSSPFVVGLSACRPVLDKPQDFVDVCRSGDVHDMVMQQRFGVAPFCQLRADLRALGAAKRLGVEAYVRQFAAPVRLRTTVECDGYGPDALGRLLTEHDDIRSDTTGSGWRGVVDRTRAQLRHTDSVSQQHQILERTWVELRDVPNNDMVFAGFVGDTDLSRADLNYIMGVHTQ